MKRFVTLCILCLGMITFAQSKEQKIREAIALTNGSKVASFGIKEFIGSYKEKYKDLPDSFWSEFLEEGEPDKIDNLYIPIYDKFYTEAEIDQLIVFYKTEVGKKLIANMLPIMQGTMQSDEIFTEAELGQLEAFNKTEVGEKMIANIPSIMEETKIFAMNLNDRINKKINNHFGYQSPPPPSAPKK